MTPEEMKKMVESAILCSDQLVFVYQKDDGSDETRFVTPINMELKAGVTPSGSVLPLDDLMLLCKQHLPEEDFRKFSMARMKDMARVVKRAF